MADYNKIEFHQKWIGYLNPTGLVFSPQAIEDAQVVISESVVTEQKQFASLVTYEAQDKLKFKGFDSCKQIFKEVLNWRDGDLVSDAAVVSDFTFRHPQFDELVSPTYVSMVDKVPKILIQEFNGSVDFDKNTNSQDNWNSSIHFKFERLLREKQIATGILVSREKLRLIYAPRGETSGFIDFKFEIMHQPSGRIIFAAFKELLSDTRVFNSPKGQSLIEILETSREYQSKVSIALSGQVLEALYELLRGFQAAYDEDKRDLILKVQKENPQLIYEGLLTVLLRMVFTMYAEDRELLATDEVYQSSYSLAGLYDRLRLDAAQNPDTMDYRYGAWAHLISLFRLIYDGAEYSSNKGLVKLPARHGHLFDPNIYLFLEGRYKREDPYDIAPKVSDGVIFRILTKLLYLKGERINYRTLDVEQIGSVYETMMGFELDIAKGPTVAIVPIKSHGAPIPINLEEILEAKSPSKLLADVTDVKLPDKVKKEFDAAETVEELEKILEISKKIDRRATLYTLSKGAMVLRPSESRRKSGSHYTPRDLTEPIVRTALRPIFERLDANPSSEQILALKICDPAMGSGAFLVEVCRQLAEKLVDSWTFYKTKIDLPRDEDHLMFAKRMIAQKCLYGVDKNHMAVNLAKLSLWLVTLAKDHAFNFLDHNLKNGDSLVGLTNKQIMSFDYKDRPDLPLFQYFKERLYDVIDSREEIQNASDESNYDALKMVEDSYKDEIEPLRLAGDLALKCFFEGKSSQERDKSIQYHQLTVLNFLSANSFVELTEYCKIKLGDFKRKYLPFHWELEFPEVFSRENGGFDCFVGNPPFLGGARISTNYGDSYRDWLLIKHPWAHGNGDLVAHFFCDVFSNLRDCGVFGLISTKTISQGDTRISGLEWIRKNSGQIFNASTRIKWPGEATVVVSVIHIIKRKDEYKNIILNDKTVNKITAFMLPQGPDCAPQKLKVNSGSSFIGVALQGYGFAFDNSDRTGKASNTEVMNGLIAKNKKNIIRIKPYIGGTELMNSYNFSSQRYVIDLNDLDEKTARAQYPDLLEIVEEKVKPDRLTNKRENYRKYWWHFGEKRPGLFKAISELKKVIAMCQTAKYQGFIVLENNFIFDQKAVIIASESYSKFAVLQSKIHEMWALFLGSSLGETPVYTPSDCYETFPFPLNELGSELESIGLLYHKERDKIMIEKEIGITDFYNDFHNIEVQSKDFIEFRSLQKRLDESVLKAYGWNDIKLEYQFVSESESEHEMSDKNWRFKFSEEVHDDILARLLRLNQEVFENEIRTGLQKMKRD